MLEELGTESLAAMARRKLESDKLMEEMYLQEEERLREAGAQGHMTTEAPAKRVRPNAQ